MHNPQVTRKSVFESWAVLSSKAMPGSRPGKPMPATPLSKSMGGAAEAASWLQGFTGIAGWRSAPNSLSILCFVIVP
jgi:hypothetical protein